MRIAIDPMYGVSLTALSTILSIARCTIETINSRHDTLFGGKMPAPTERTLRNLQNYVLDRYCDIGIATDGDADRWESLMTRDIISTQTTYWSCSITIC